VTWRDLRQCCRAPRSAPKNALNLKAKLQIELNKF
jgi:hypothetical protein